MAVLAAPRQQLAKALALAALGLWILVLPIGAWLEGFDTFGGRVGASAAAGITGAALALVVSGLVLARLEAAADRAAAEQEAALNRAAAAAERRDWEVRTRYIVAGLVEDVSADLADIVPSVYEAFALALPKKDVIAARFLVPSITIPSTDLDALAKAILQSRRVMRDLIATARSVRPDHRGDKPAPLDAQTVASLVVKAQAAGGPISDRAASLLSSLERLTSYLPEPATDNGDERTELMTAAIELRINARNVGAAFTEKPSEWTLATDAFDRSVAATHLLLAALRLVNLLTSVHDRAVVGTRPSIDPESARLEAELDQVKRWSGQISSIDRTLAETEASLKDAE